MTPTTLPVPRPVISRPKPTRQPKSKKRAKPRRKVLEGQLEAIVKQIVFWRDGARCVLADIDGGRCSGKLNWGHFVPRARSKWLKYDLATFVQCDAHNLIHDSRKTGGGDPIFGLWFVKSFGLVGLEAMSIAQREHQNENGKRSIPELEEMLAHYDQLYQDRFHAPIGDTAEMVEAGYFGQVLKDAVGLAAQQKGILLSAEILAAQAEKGSER